MIHNICNTLKYTLVFFNMFRVFCMYNLKFFVIVILLSDKISKSREFVQYTRVKV